MQQPCFAEGYDITKMSPGHFNKITIKNARHAHP